MEELSGRTAVVIGGGSGIGRGIALGLADEAMSVVVADIDPASASAVAEEITGRGGRADGAAVDATRTDSLEDLAELAQTRHGHIHLLVSTVGVILDRRLDQATEEEWAWFLEFNVLAQVRGVNVFLPRLRAHGQPAHVVLTSSMAGLLALPPPLVGGVNNGLYTTTKHALIGYSDMLRAELAPEGIGVSVLCPGLVVGQLGVTSARHRPERFGGPLPVPDPNRTMPPSAMPSEAVGPMVARAVRANRFYIFTHPDTAGLVVNRHRALLEDYAFAAGGPGIPRAESQ